jgi:hypothetical protein
VDTAFTGNRNDLAEALAELTNAQAGLIVFAVRQDGVSIATALTESITARLWTAQ